MNEPVTAKRLLAATGPEEVFSGPENVEIEYRVLAKKYHPDLNRGDPRAEEVFKQLGVLHTRAKEKIKIGEWIDRTISESCEISGGSRYGEHCFRVMLIDLPHPVPFRNGDRVRSGAIGF
jgi:hypothetical protein